MKKKPMVEHDLIPPMAGDADCAYRAREYHSRTWFWQYFSSVEQMRKHQAWLDELFPGVKLGVLLPNPNYQP